MVRQRIANGKELTIWRENDHGVAGGQFVDSGLVYFLLGACTPLRRMFLTSIGINLALLGERVKPRIVANKLVDGVRVATRRLTRDPCPYKHCQCSGPDVRE